MILRVNAKHLWKYSVCGRGCKQILNKLDLRKKMNSRDGQNLSENLN